MNGSLSRNRSLSSAFMVSFIVGYFIHNLDLPQTFKPSRIMLH